MNRQGGVAKGRAALFLDRDGVINEDRHYVHQISDFHFIDGIFSLCRHAKAQGFAIIVVTNQAGIGRGYYTEEQFMQLTTWMEARFREEGAALDKVYFCPFHPEEGIGKYRKDSFDRKPNPGMIFRARDELSLNLSSSWLVGDKITDIQAAYRAGVGHAALFSCDGGDYQSDKPALIVKHLNDLIGCIEARE